MYRVCSYTGYCNPKGQCISVDSQDLINELDDLLNNLSAKKAWAWLVNNWPYALGALAGLLLLAFGLMVGPAK
jgi:hypothetical protein